MIEVPAVLLLLVFLVGALFGAWLCDKLGGD